MEYSGTPDPFNNLFLDRRYASLGAGNSGTMEKRGALIFARGSAAISTLLSGLIVFFVAADSRVYQSLVPLALTYSFAYALAAYWTWRMSRVAAIFALLLYVPMHHSDCGLVHIAASLSVCIIYAAGIASTMLIQKRRRDGMPD